MIPILEPAQYDPFGSSNDRLQSLVGYLGGFEPQESQVLCCPKTFNRFLTNLAVNNMKYGQVFQCARQADIRISTVSQYHRELRMPGSRAHANVFGDGTSNFRPYWRVKVTRTRIQLGRVGIVERVLNAVLVGRKCLEGLCASIFG